MKNERPEPTSVSNNIKIFSPIVIKVFVILFIFNIANNMLSEFIRKNKIIVIKEYYDYSFKNVADKSKVDLFVKATSDLVEEISRIDRFILETNTLARIIRIIEYIFKSVILYAFSFFLTNFYVRYK
ncbi:MAG: hypothetical protein L3J75_05230 [Methylococcaceae bacterium]|nr:hypothetical protein [Methylococcaceae bacterium]